MDSLMIKPILIVMLTATLAGCSSIAIENTKGRITATAKYSALVDPVSVAVRVHTALDNICDVTKKKSLWDLHGTLEVPKSNDRQVASKSQGIQSEIDAYIKTIDRLIELTSKAVGVFGQRTYVTTVECPQPSSK